MKNLNNIKEGDYVKCVISYHNELILNNVYKVEDIRNDIIYTVINNCGYKKNYLHTRFILDLKYNRKQKLNKLWKT